MKLSYLTLTFWLLIGCVYGQETFTKSRSLDFIIKEKFHILKSDKKTKHGEYIAEKSKVLIARGKYDHGKRVGYWSFSNFKGEAIQSYNYNTDQLMYTDTADAKELKYSFEILPKENDTINYPVKIGGFYYGLTPLVNKQDELIKKLFTDLVEAKTLEFLHVFSVDTGGKLLKHEVFVSGNNVNKSYTFTDSNFDDEFTKFVPAKINHSPVECKVYVRATVSMVTETTVSAF